MQSISSDDGTLSQKSKLQNKIIMKTDLTRQRPMRRIRHLHHLHPLPLLPPSDEEEERHYNLPEQEKYGAKSS